MSHSVDDCLVFAPGLRSVSISLSCVPPHVTSCVNTPIRALYPRPIHVTGLKLTNHKSSHTNHTERKAPQIAKLYRNPRKSQTRNRANRQRNPQYFANPPSAVGTCCCPQLLDSGVDGGVVPSDASVSVPAAVHSCWTAVWTWA